MPKPLAYLRQLFTCFSDSADSPSIPLTTTTNPSGSKQEKKVSSKSKGKSTCGSLEERYGKPGRVLGDGANGIVQVHTNPKDGTVVAVKKFRTQKPKEDEKKIRAEFAIGSSLKNAHIISVMEIIKERGEWYQVAEYAPIELCELAETRTMSTEEIYCAWAQILEGANYMHKMGIAHRDLSLENVVMTDNGIMKIIDFGCAMVFRQPSSDKTVFARGYIGCEPYMPPEMFMGSPYDARAVDVWCLAIMFVRLILHRFPWDKAQLSDPSYDVFSQQPSPLIPRGEPIGPSTLLKELPKECRMTLKGMLQTSPGRRISLRQVLQHPWMKRIAMCEQDPDGTIHRARGHGHGVPSDPLYIDPEPSGENPETNRKDNDTEGWIKHGHGLSDTQTDKIQVEPWPTIPRNVPSVYRSGRR